MLTSALLLAAVAGATTPATTLPAPAQAAPDIAFTRYQLDNGLDVILAPDHSTPIVHVDIWYHVGSKDETTGLTGFAHLFEHLMFQGSISANDDYFKQLEKIGAKVNGTTNSERTNFFETVPAQYLPTALFLESDRMGWLLDALDKDKLDNQREVVKNERRQRYENPPYGLAYTDLFAALWPAGHPYAHPTIGSHEDLERASLDDVKAFFSRWYVPDNASLVISGDFDDATAKKLVQQYFGSIPKGTADRTRQTTADVTLAADTEIRQYKPVPQRKVWLAWTTPKGYAPGDADLDLLSFVLSNGEDSRLYQHLVKETGVAQDIYCGQQSLSIQSAYVCQATAAKGHTTDEVVKALDETFASVLGQSPPTKDEIDAAKANYQVGFFAGLQTISGKAETLSSYDYLQHDPGYLKKDLQRYLDATPESVEQAGKTWLTAHRVVLHILPKADEPKPVEPPPPPPPPPVETKGKKKTKKGGN